MTKPKILPFNPDANSAVLSDDLTRLADIIDSVLPGRGRELVVKIAKEFAGSYVYFQQREKIFRITRDQWIIEQYEAGHRVPEIAREVQLSERQIWTILGREPDEERQMSLF